MKEDRVVAEDSASVENKSALGEGKRRHGCFFYGCLTLVMLGVVLAGGCLTFFLHGKRKLGAPCEQYLAAVERGDYQAAYQMVGNRWKQEQSFEEYVALEKMLRQALGKFHKKSAMGVRAFAAPRRGGVGQILYRARFENGECTITFSLEKSQGQWVIEAVHYDSPALLDLLTCPHCGAFQKSFGKFCANCGKPMCPPNASDVTTPDTVNQ